LKKIISAALLCISFCYQGFGIGANENNSNSDTTHAKERFSQTLFGLNYASANTYNGRKDTNKIRVLSPTFKYIGKRGIFVKLDAVNVPHAKKTFDELNVNFGWENDLRNDWDATINFSHFFYDSKVARINAAVSNELNTYVGKDWDILYTSLDLSLDAGNNKFPYIGKIISQKSRDFFMNFSNNHEFVFDHLKITGDSIKIIPIIT
jgi:hypothetical protein